ncbi:pseudouridylate synthase [Leptospira hartskeerlii]|uniref:Pseudouridylate synthase n=1 Tax=Leptospira hartskeerlii TaxID=2023177 RepID=A0A2M9XC32_9LEPT|nr:RluA family pseudouridine synthase [Leptospira hartskeerlii]PJZ25240.1 pseudouridylate synthase [Leptospira hartskeerlii]PJZ33631.1 pseudouridylate synthase [Leptospira hartskeerlii]
MDVFLAFRFTYQSRSNWRKILEEGKILVQGKVAKPSYSIKEGDEILYLPGEIFEPPVQTDFKILFEDSRYIAVEKPGDIPIHSAGRYRKNNLTDLLEEDSRFEKIYTIHRLDRETSGVVVFGKDSEAASKFADLFSKRKVNKTYISYVWGNFPTSFRAKGYLISDPSSLIRKKRKFVQKDFFQKLEIPEEDSETCETNFRKIGEGTLHGVPFSKVYCFPKTGRLHQIRATLYSLGFPLLGDKIYGKDESAFIEFIEGKDPDLIAKLGMNRQALHSSSLKFIHPFTGIKTKIGSDLPEDFPE